MQGKIIKGIAGFYYVNVVESGVYECKAKGVFRKEKIKPLVGDNVRIEILDEENKTGNIVIVSAGNGGEYISSVVSSTAVLPTITFKPPISLENI